MKMQKMVMLLGLVVLTGQVVMADTVGVQERTNDVGTKWSGTDAGTLNATSEFLKSIKNSQINLSGVNKLQFNSIYLSDVDLARGLVSSFVRAQGINANVNFATADVDGIYTAAKVMDGIPMEGKVTLLTTSKAVRSLELVGGISKLSSVTPRAMITYRYADDLNDVDAQVKFLKVITDVADERSKAAMRQPTIMSGFSASAVRTLLATTQHTTGVAFDYDVAKRLTSDDKVQVQAAGITLLPE